MNIDRGSRDELVAVMDRYLHDELTSFEFDEEIFAIRGRSRDKTVRRVVDILWHYYDDCHDHKVHLDRIIWNYFQRLRLLLMSDAALAYFSRRVWSAAQIVAAVALAGFVWAVSKAGLGQQWMLVAIPFGLVSIGLSAWRTQVYWNADHRDLSLYPFSSISQLLWVGHDASGFRRERYRSELTSRRIRNTGSLFLLQLQMYLPWLLFGPVVLVGQMFPLSIPDHRVVPQ